MRRGPAPGQLGVVYWVFSSEDSDHWAAAAAATQNIKRGTETVVRGEEGN